MTDQWSRDLPAHDQSLERDDSTTTDRTQPDDTTRAEAPAAPPRAITPVADVAPAPATEDAPGESKRSFGRYALMFSVPLVLLAVGGYFYMTSGRSVATDNAYVSQEKISVSSEVGGTIVEVAVHENQTVKAGDLLFRLDPEPYRIALAQAEAEIASAQAKVTTMATTADSMGSEIDTARRAVTYAQSNLDRERALMARGFNTRARMDAAESALNEARGRLSDAQAAAVRARAQLATGSIAPGINPGILAAQARREQALLQLRRTEVRAPSAGIVSQSDRLHVGQTMVAGLPAVSIVAGQRSWVEANFKETDLNHMLVGQRATLTFDAYPDIELTGHVASIGAGTGSEFSVLPAQNATGNWVKVTQRVPVRIAIDEASPRPLIAGLSTHVIVHFNQQH